MDIVYVAGIIVFFALTVALVIGCAKIGGPKSSTGEKS
jgi:hypothetical protein